MYIVKLPAAFRTRIGSVVVSSSSRRRRREKMGGAQLMKRVPRIKFPQRHPKPAGSESQTAAPLAGNRVQTLFSGSKASPTLGGKASEQPPRTPVSKEEIDAILLGGSI